MRRKGRRGKCLWQRGWTHEGEGRRGWTHEEERRGPNACGRVHVGGHIKGRGGGRQMLVAEDT